VGGGGEAGAKVIEIQRSRILAAAIAEFAERGYSQTTVAHIAGRARISRRTFYDVFEDREACLEAVCAQALALIEQELTAASLAGRAWQQRIRVALEAILGFFDREPALARVCVVQTLHAGSLVLERREAALERLVAVVDEGREGSRAAGCTRLTAEGLVGAVLAIVHSRLSRREHGVLLGLTGELAAMIVLPYLGPGAARREQKRPTPTPAMEARGSADIRGTDPLDGVEMRLTYRTVRILEGAHEHPGASNRRLADLAGIHDQGQASKLLARLERLGLIANGGTRHAKGEPNDWTLTSTGKRLTQSIRAHTPNKELAA
jgi:AcrR family transcriptional regulator